MSEIPPLATLPEPTREGMTDDGWISKVWVHGDRILRIRHMQKRATLNEFVGGESVRVLDGSLTLVVSFGKHWFKEVGWEGFGP